MGDGFKDGEKMIVATTGDTMMSRRLSLHGEDRYLSMVKVVREADVSFTNLEGGMHDFEGFPNKPGTEAFFSGAPTWTADELRWMGFNVVALANNHAMDCSEESLLATMRALDKAGISYSGAGRDLRAALTPAYLETRRGRVALLSVASCTRPLEMASHSAFGIRGRPGINGLRLDTTYVVDRETLDALRKIGSKLSKPRVYAWNANYSFGKDVPYREPRKDELIFLNERFVVGNPPGIRMSPVGMDVEANLREIESAKMESDLVLVSFHQDNGSMEDPRQPDPYIVEFAHDCIDAGADAILGHGDHVGRGIEVYEGKPIFYSLGTFMYQGETLPRYPYESYEKIGLDPAKATKADYLKTVEKWRAKFPPEWWFKTVLAVFKTSGGDLSEIKLYPVDAGYERPLTRRGRPMLADEKVGREIIDYYSEMSAPFGTRIEYKEGVGEVKVKK